MSSTTPDDDHDRTVIRPAQPASGSRGTPTRSVPGNALPVGLRLGEFEITGVVGEGGFGIVYLVWDHSLDRRVALKEYMPASLACRTDTTTVAVRSERHAETFEAGRRSFVNEAKLLAQFDHPSLVKVYRFWEANGTAYMVMPYYEGITLKDHLRQLGAPPDETWLMALLAPLTEALAVIHAERCYHRDIAPDNIILLAGSQRPLLLDFGAARRVIGDMTQALTVILKPGYAPVEQYAEVPDMKQGAWTDVYALAATVHCALTGQTPPPSVSRLLSDCYVPLTQRCAGRCSERFLAAIDKALRVQPQQRTQTIAELRADLGLDDAVSPAAATTVAAPARPVVNRTTAMPPPAKARPAPAPSSARPIWPIAAGVGALVLAGAGFWFVSGRPDRLASAVPPAPEPATSAVAVAPPAEPAASTVPVTAASAADPPAATPTAAATDPVLAFAHVMAVRTAGFEVEAAQFKPSLRIGRDRLGFTLTSSQDGEVSVFVLGPDGSLVRLFPNRELPRVRIQAGQPLRLPPGSLRIDVTEPPGAERFLAIVSRWPRRHDQLGGSVQGGYLILPADAVARQAAAARDQQALPLLLGRAQGCPAEPCDDYGAVRFDIDVVR